MAELRGGMRWLQADPQDLDKATRLAFRYALGSPELLRGAGPRRAFVDFVALVAQAHPIDRHACLFGRLAALFGSFASSSAVWGVRTAAACATILVAFCRRFFTV